MLNLSIAKPVVYVDLEMYRVNPKMKKCPTQFTKAAGFLKKAHIHKTLNIKDAHTTLS